MASHLGWSNEKARGIFDAVMLNLRPDQKEVLKWIVDRIKEGVLDADFDVFNGCAVFVFDQPRDVATEGYLPRIMSHKTRAIPGGTEGVLSALVKADCLHAIETATPAYYGRRSYAVTALGFEAVESNFVEESRPAAPPPVTNYNTQVHEGGVAQIGQYNQMEIRTVVETIVQGIDGSLATSEQKSEAKSLLVRCLEHPTVGSVLGSLASSLVQALTK